MDLNRHHLSILHSIHSVNFKTLSTDSLEKLAKFTNLQLHKTVSTENVTNGKPVKQITGFKPPDWNKITEEFEPTEADKDVSKTKTRNLSGSSK